MWLDGIRVLDLSGVLAGPLATQQLGDLGAEVIKVESPRGGDPTRQWGPPFTADGRSAYFLGCNRGKRSLAIDLRRPEGRDVVRRLCAEVDVLVDNFPPGLLERWGLDRRQLRVENPRLITCRISGFGATGTRSQEGGYDAMVQALSGLMSITGPSDGPWSKVGVAVVDVVAGLHVATGILAALRGRDQEPALASDERHLEVCLFDAALSLLANVTSSALATGTEPARHGNAHPSIVPYEVFEVADGQILVAVGSDAQWRRLAEALGHAEWADDPRWRTNPARVEHRAALIPEISAALAGLTRGQAVARLQAARVPVGALQTVQEALADPAAVERGAITDHGDGTRSVTNPMRVADSPGSPAAPAPQLGADTEAILRDLGISQAEIRRWTAEGVISAPSDEV